MTWHVLHCSDSNPEHLFDPYDEWKSEWLGYFFVEPDEYEKYKAGFDDGVKITGHLYAFRDKKLEGKMKLSSLRLRKSQRYVEELPDGDVDEIHAWVDERAIEHNRDRFSHMYELIGDEAIAFFEAHLVDDPHTVEMLEALDTAEDRHRAWGLRDVMEAAMFLRALDLCGMERAQDLPFELPEMICNTINGAATKTALEEHCEWLEEREAAATLNMLDRKCSGKKPYQWTWDIIIGGQIEDDAATLSRVASGDY